MAAIALIAEAPPRTPEVAGGFGSPPRELPVAETEFPIGIRPAGIGISPLELVPGVIEAILWSVGAWVLISTAIVAG